MVCSLAGCEVKVWGEGSETIINSHFPQPYRPLTNSGAVIPSRISHCRRCLLTTGKWTVLTLLWRVTASWMYNTCSPRYCQPSLKPAAPRLVRVWVPHGTATIPVLRPPKTPRQPLRLGSGFQGMLFDVDPLLGAHNREMGPHGPGPGTLSERLLSVVALREKVDKFHLALRITAAAATHPQRTAIQKSPSCLTRDFHEGKKETSFLLTPRAVESEEEGSGPVTNQLPLQG